MLIKFWGAERVLLELIWLFPDADIFTLLYDEKKMQAFFPGKQIHCIGPAQWLFCLTGKPRWSLPLMPASVRKIDLSGYDVVISSSSGFAHGVMTTGQTKNICYYHSPARYLWDATDEVQAELGVSWGKWQKNIFWYIKAHVGGFFVRGLFHQLRKYDLKASKKPHFVIANSEEVRKRIQTYYHRDALILWPPVDTHRFSVGSIPVSQRTQYVLTSALTPFKRVDRVVRVMTRLGMQVQIIGDGKERQSLEKIAGKNIQFLGRVSDSELVEIYKSARGFLMPQKEDAGIAPLEAMAAGVPVYWFGHGWLLETNIDGVTGRFYSEDTDESFEAWFLRFHQEISQGKYDNSSFLIERAREFDGAHFRESFQRIIQDYV